MIYAAERSQISSQKPEHSNIHRAGTPHGLRKQPESSGAGQHGGTTGSGRQIYNKRFGYSACAEDTFCRWAINRFRSEEGNHMRTESAKLCLEHTPTNPTPSVDISD